MTSRCSWPEGPSWHWDAGHENLPRVTARGLRRSGAAKTHCVREASTPIGPAHHFCKKIRLRAGVASALCNEPQGFPETGACFRSLKRTYDQAWKS